MIKWKKIWTDNRIGDSGAGMISESLKTNTTLTELWLGGDEKWSRMIWIIIIIIKKMKEWKNEMKNINDNENTEEREIEMINDNDEMNNLNRLQYWRFRSNNDKWNIEN